MKFNKYFMLGLAGLAFAACSNDEDITNGNEDGRVRVTLSLGGTEATRSLGASAAGLYNKVTDVKIVFYNGAGAYVAFPSQGTIGGVAYDNEAAINDAVKKGLNETTDHKVTVELKEVPSSASQIYIVANSEGKTNQIGTTSLNEARKTQIHLKNQIKNDFEVFSGEESRLTGLAAIASDGSAEVQLRPAPSRIEMAKVTAVPVPSGETWGGAAIKSFEVAGFYINKFRISGYLDGKALGLAEITDGAQDYGDKKAEYTKAKYTEKTWGMMCDEPVAADYSYANGDGTNTVYTATPAVATNWYGYMLLQGTPCHVVVKLNVTYSDDTVAEKFLTITNYKYGTTWEDFWGETHQAGSDVAEFLRGHVYKLTDITFDVTDLTDVPYETTKTVTAVVEVLRWVGVDVTPGFN